jgi:hypothetical protein
MLVFGSAVEGPLLTIFMSADGEPAVVVALAELFAGFGSDSDAETDAVFVFVPDVDAVTTIDMVAFALAASEPSEQVTTPDAWLQVPCELDAETNVVPAGSVSVTVTFVAVCGPAFETPSE